MEIGGIKLMSSETITRNDLEAILNELFNPLPLIDLYESDGGATTSATGNHKLVENELPKISGRLTLRNYGSSGGATAYNPTGHFSMAEASSTSGLHHFL